MGYRFEVWAWVKSDNGYDWRDTPEYQGQSLIRALIAAARAKRSGIGCVRLVWR